MEVWIKREVGGLGGVSGKGREGRGVQERVTVSGWGGRQVNFPRKNPYMDLFF